MSLNYNNICRSCLNESYDMKSIFSTTLNEPSIVLSEILKTCASVQVTQGDGLPENICSHCLDQMNLAYSFRKLCENSDSILRKQLNSSDSCVSFESEGAEHDSNEGCCRDNWVDSSLELESASRVPEVSQKKFSPRTYDCKECGQKCAGLSGYRKHIAITHEITHTCDICNETFKTELQLTRHRNSHNDHKPKLHNNKTTLKNHHNLPKTCDICNKTFRFHSNLERHKLIHTGEKPFLCNVCGKGFAQLSYLKIHSFIHTGEKPYKCHMCEKSFAAPGTLMTHVRTHTGERPHVCKICGKDFPQSGYLAAHIRTHTGEKPVECKVCQRRFNQSGRLIVHMRIHSGEKPYSCKECGRSFAVRGTLKKHMRTHTGERPYLCKVCGQAFAQSGTLSTHMKVHKPRETDVADCFTTN